MLLIIAATVVGLVAVLYGLSRTFLLASFERLEDRTVRQNVERAVSALSLELGRLDSVAGDWATWDATYAFVQERETGYVEENLTPSAFATVRVQLMLFADLSGDVVFGRAVDLETNRAVPFPESLLGEVARTNLLGELSESGSQLSGMIVLPERPLLVAARPILTSSGEGPSRGTLLVGRYLDAAEIADLSESLHLRLGIQTFEGGRVPPDLLKARSESGGPPIQVRPTSRSAIWGYAVLQDIYGNDALALGIEMPREIYAHGQATLVYLVAALAAVGLVFGASSLFLLERYVLSRLARLAAAVGRVAGGSDLAQRVPVSGKDELADLAGEMNAMLGRLESAQGRIQESEEQYRSLFEQSRDAIYITTPEGRFVDLNQATLDLFGYSPTEMESLNALDLYVDPKDRERFRAEVEKTGFVRDFAVQLRRKDGAPMDCLLTTTVRRAANGTVLEYRGLLRDVTAQKRAEARLQYVATHDALTDLPNRAAFSERLSLELAHAERDRLRLAVLLLDLDRFKQVNDSLGHAAGDELLHAVAERLKGALRKSDTVARLGGDEFLVLLPEVSRVEYALGVAQKIVDVLGRPFAVGGRDVRVTLSVGLAIYPDDGLDGDALVKSADLAMYKAKDRGRNTYERFPSS